MSRHGKNINGEEGGSIPEFCVVARTIDEVFSTPLKGLVDYTLKLNFLKGRCVGMFCDCSFNFNQIKLVKKFINLKVKKINEKRYIISDKKKLIEINPVYFIESDTTKREIPSPKEYKTNSSKV